MSDPIRCWTRHEGSRTTAPPVRTVADLGDSEGERMTAAHWFRLVASRPFGRQTTAADFVRGWRG